MLQEIEMYKRLIEALNLYVETVVRILDSIKPRYENEDKEVYEDC